LDAKSGSFGTVEVKRNNDGKLIVEFRGTFDSPIMVDDEATIIAASGSSIKQLEINTENGQAVNLQGSFKNVVVNSQTNVNLGQNTTKGTLVTNANVNINADATSKIENIEKNGNNVTIGGEGADSVTTPTIPVIGGGGGGSSTTKVSVKSVSVMPESMTLISGGATGTIQVTVTPSNATNKSVTWSSSDTSVATVANGVVTSAAAGTATITVTTKDGGYKATCTVTVLDAELMQAKEAAEAAMSAYLAAGGKATDDVYAYLVEALESNVVANIIVATAELNEATEALEAHEDAIEAARAKVAEAIEALEAAKAHAAETAEALEAAEAQAAQAAEELEAAKAAIGAENLEKLESAEAAAAQAAEAPAVARC
jgi:hypothetical protein